MPKFRSILTAALFLPIAFALTPVEQAKLTRVENDFAKLEQKLSAVFVANGSLKKPSGNRASRALRVGNDDGSLTDILGDVNLDPWGKAYRLERKGNQITLLTGGPDQTFDSRDDLTYRFTLEAKPSASATP